MMLAAYRYLFGAQGTGYYAPLPLPQRPTLGERCEEVVMALKTPCAGDHGDSAAEAHGGGGAADEASPRFPRLLEMLRFVRGERDVVAPRAVRGPGGGGGGGGGGPGCGRVISSARSGALCLPLHVHEQ